MSSTDLTSAPVKPSSSLPISSIKFFLYRILLLQHSYISQRVIWPAQESAVTAWEASFGHA